MSVKQNFKNPTSLQEAENLINIYQQLITVNSLITSSLNQKEVLTMVMSEAKNILNSESCSLLLLDKETEELVIDIALGKKGKDIQEIRIPKGQGIAGWVAQSQEDLIVNDVANDSRHFKQVDKKSSYNTKNMICTPLVHEEELIGVIQVINKNNGIFNNFDLHILKNIGIQAVTAISNAQLYEQAITDALTKTFTRRYLDMQLYREIENFKRHNRNFSTIMIDIDHFKMIN
ncbi:MAG: GAF domain-containing protein, partial [Bdellovibrionales bacterium]|nr:GAF domain-containing protein [Bdellovibrionales bacterium]